MRHLPPTGGSLCSLAAVSSAAIPVRVKLKIPRANAAAATTLDIPTGWDPNTKKEPTGLFFAACGRPCSFDSSYGLHETATTLDIPGRWDPRTKQQPTGLIAYPAAQGRAVSGCGSQRMLHALERRSHSADHGPSFASLYSPFCRYATSSPDRGKSLLAGGGQLSCNSRTGQIKNPPSECSGSNHIRHSYRMGPEH